MSCDQRAAFVAGQLDDEGRRAFQAHLDGCSTCRAAVARQHAHDVALKAWAEAPPVPPFAGAQLVAKAAAARRHRRVAGVLVAGAAAVALVFVASRSRPVEPRWLEQGESRVGDDVVTLAEASVAQVVETKTETRVALKAGRASFEVAKRQAGRRFVVAAGDVEVRVVGTKFSVTSGAAPTVEVDEGTVEVWRGAQREALLHGGERWPALAPEVDAGVPVEPETPSAPPPKPVAPLDSDAVMKLVARGKLDDAAALLGAHLQRAPADTKAWALLGDVRRKQQRHREAVDAYERASRSNDPELRNRSRLLGASLLQDSLNDEARASRLLEQATRDPKLPAAMAAPMMVRLAKSKLVLRRTDEARALLEQVLQRHGASPSAVEARELLRTLPR